MSVNSLMMPYPFFGPNMCDAYSNQVLLNDKTNLSLFTPPYNSTGFYPSFTGGCPMPFMGMDSSIFSNPYSMPFMGSSMPYPSFYPAMDNNYYEKMMENQVNYQQQTRSADIKLNAAQRNLRQKGLTLNEKIQLNEQEQIMPAFKEYVEAVKQYYGYEGSEEDLKNTALDSYQQQFGKTIQRDIRENGSNSLWHGFKEVITLGYADGTSAEQNIAEITGQKEGKLESLKESTGNALAGTTLGLATGGVLKSKSVISKLPFLKKSPKLWIPAAIGTVVGWLFGKVFTK